MNSSIINGNLVEIVNLGLLLHYNGKFNVTQKHIAEIGKKHYPASFLRKSTSVRHRPVSYPDGPMTARYRFT